MRRPSLALLAPAALLLPAAAVAQSPAPTAPFTLTLSRPEAEFAEPYTNVGGVRELRDGRVVVTDRIEKVIHVVDFAAGSAKRVGAEGGGPNEYRMPISAFAMPGDSTLVFDAGNFRYVVVAPNGAIARTFNPSENAAGGPMGMLNARGVDGAGNLYFLDRGLRTQERIAGGNFNGSFETPDSGSVMRYDLKTGKVEPVGRIALPKMNVTASSNGGEQRVMMRASNPYAAQDDWTIAPDGRIALVRHDPYRVEWLAPNGQRVVGPAVSYRKIPITDRDKQEYMERMRNPNNAMRVTIGGPGGGSGRAAPPPNIPMPAPTDWPEVKPPFTGNAAVAAPDGRLWVLRTRAAGDEVPSYDVFDSYAKLVGTVKLPPRTRLVGFGRNSAYVVRTDEDDLQYLQKFRLF